MKTIEIKPLSRLRFETGQFSCRAFAKKIGVSASTIDQTERGAYPGEPWKLIDSISKTFSLSLDTARAICNGTISESELQAVLKQLKTKAKSGGK